MYLCIYIKWYARFLKMKLYFVIDSGNTCSMKKGKELLSIGMCINGHLTKKKKYVECHNFLKIKNNKLLNVEYL